MKKHILTKCEICGEERTSRGMSQHIKKAHSMTVENYIIKYVYNGDHPTCQCGCENNVTIRGYSVMDFIDGHSPAGHFKKGETPKRNYDKWKKNLVDGIRNYNKVAKTNDPSYRSGTNNNFYGKKHSESTKNRIRQAVEQQIRSGNHSFLGNDNGRIGRSSLETKFENYLISKEIKFVPGFKVQYQENKDKFPRNKYYDFYIPIINTVIEIHGSYWHPQTEENLTEIQKGNLKNDIFKKSLAKSRFYDILTIYDYELDDFINHDILVNIINGSAVSDLTKSGFLIKTNTIELPDYWTGLIDTDSITVTLTPVGKYQKLFVKDIVNNTVIVDNDNLLNKDIDCFYTVWAERKDVGKLEVES